MTDRAIAVTGAGGFIGSVTVRALLDAGADVRGLVGPAGPDAVAAPAGGGPWRWGEIVDPVAVGAAIAGCGTVIHLAGPSSVSRSFAAPTDAMAAHAVGTTTVLEAAARAGCVQRLVLVSSAEVYGIPIQHRVTETHPLSPLSPYAAAKVAAECVARALAAVYDIELVVVRPFAVYGPGSPGWSLVATAVRQALEADSIRMADLSRVRDLTYVDDVADLLVRAASVRLDPPGAVLNACTGVGTTVGGLVREALAAAGRAAPVVSYPMGDPTVDQVLAGRRPPATDPARLVGDPSRAAAMLGWAAGVDLAEGLRRMVTARVASR